MAILQSKENFVQASSRLGLFLGAFFAFLPCMLLAQNSDKPVEKKTGLQGLRLNAGAIDMFTCDSVVAIALGELWCGTRYEIELSLGNTGSSDINLEDVLSSCGCFNGVSESNVIGTSEPVMQHVSMMTSEGTRFSQQLEFRSRDFVAPKKIKFVATCRARAAFNPAQFRLQGRYPTDVYCIPEPDAGSIIGIVLDEKSVTYMEIESDAKRRADGAVPITLKPLDSITDRQFGFKQLFKVQFELNGVYSTSIIPLDARCIVHTRVSSSKLRFVKREKSKYSIVMILTRGEDVSEI